MGSAAGAHAAVRRCGRSRGALPVTVYSVGLGCVDLLLRDVERPLAHAEDVVQFRGGVEECAGGGVFHTLRALHAALAESPTEGGAAVRVRLEPIACVGDDAQGRRYCEALSSALGRDRIAANTLRGVASVESCSTGVSVVVEYRQGGRACFLDGGANAALDVPRIDDALRELDGDRCSNGCTGPVLFHVAYPHLLPRLRPPQAALSQLLHAAIHEWFRGRPVALALDTNGASMAPRLDAAAQLDQLAARAWLRGVLPQLHLLHANYEEACALLGESPLLAPPDEQQSAHRQRRRQDAWRLLQALCHLVSAAEEASSSSTTTSAVRSLAITLGADGSLLVAGSTRALQALGLAALDKFYAPAPPLPPGAGQRTTGCGDAYLAGMMHAYLRDVWQRPLSPSAYDDAPRLSQRFVQAAHASVVRQLARPTASE
ncbi:hypothetical protein CDCA_CDCA05G1594 [Cyanidium caldarium]|uniref:Carbohydrate kinase PfkB domain-containing protein n=1 Tax=Cyanidium caldarium TaxID=2771 RepID=A0AAV9ITJ6_CYACA|nr:hypothetical protein CDCA_CDCA05G1594 [Cyanidium caldarium]